MLRDDQALLAILALDDARCPVAELRLDVFVPQIERLKDVAVGIDAVVGAGHQGFLWRRRMLRHANAATPPTRVWSGWQSAALVVAWVREGRDEHSVSAQANRPFCRQHPVA